MRGLTVWLCAVSRRILRIGIAGSGSPFGLGFGTHKGNFAIFDHQDFGLYLLLAFNGEDVAVEIEGCRSVSLNWLPGIFGAGTEQQQAEEEEGEDCSHDEDFFSKMKFKSYDSFDSIN